MTTIPSGGERKRLLVYIPVYNCRERIIPLIDEIPNDIWDQSEILVIDNRSQDGTLELLKAANETNRWRKKIHLIQPNENLGYSGSQKLAYRLALQDGQFEWIMMLHGDGQYDPRQISNFLAHRDSTFEVIHGCRSKLKFWRQDETPWASYFTIKMLSLLESLITGYWRKEWHSGMVMYRASFLKRVNFTNITPTMHIDGHLLYAAGKLNAPVLEVPIYKRYKNYEAIGKTARIKYVLDVLRLMPRLRSISVDRLNHSQHEAVLKQSYVSFFATDNMDI